MIVIQTFSDLKKTHSLDHVILPFFFLFRNKHCGVMVQKIYARRFEASLWWSDEEGIFSGRVTI